MVQLYHKMSFLEQTSAIVGIRTLCKMMGIQGHFLCSYFHTSVLYRFLSIWSKSFVIPCSGTEVNIKHEH